MNFISDNPHIVLFTLAVVLIMLVKPITRRLFK